MLDRVGDTAPVDDHSVVGSPPEAEPQSAEVGTVDLVEGDLFVEDVSIDGMCGVY